MTLKSHSKKVICLLVNGDHLISGSSDDIRIWNSGKCEHIVQGHTHTID